MNIDRMTLFVLLASSLSACDPSSTPVDPESSTPSSIEARSGRERRGAVADEPAALPSGVDAREVAGGLRPLLQARHPEDLPSAGELFARPGSADALRWIATHDEQVVVRARSLALLRHYPDAATERVLVEVTGDASLPATIRAAAVRTLGAFDLEARSDLRGLAIEALRAGALPVEVAAVEALQGTASARPQLEARLADHDTSPMLAGALDRALSQ